MSTHVTMCFDVHDDGERERVFAWLREHPRDLWNYEERVKEHLHLHFHTHWTDEDILDTDVARLNFDDAVSVIEYRATLRRGAAYPRLLVDLLHRCQSVPENSMGGHWSIDAWYRREGEAR